MKRFATIFVLLLLGIAFIGCGGSSRPSGEVTDFVSPDPSYRGMDLGEHVTLSITWFGTEQRDAQLVVAEANRRFFNPIINTTLEVLWVPGASRGTMYPLILASGEADIVFTAPWHLYDEEAAKGSFQEITPEFAQRWMPNVWRTQLPLSWEQARTQGVVYAIPTSRAGAEYKFALIRDDLREKYNLPVPTDWASLENYIFTVSRNEPTVGGYETAATTWELMQVYLEYRDVLTTPQPVYFAWHDQRREPTADELHFLYTSEWYRDYVHIMARWYANDTWSRNVMNNTVGVRDNFENGRSASMFWNMTLFQVGKTMETNGHGRAGWYDISPNATIRRMSFNNNMWAISSMSPVIERSAVVLDLMKTNDELVWLLKGGIEGVHWIREPNNQWSPGPENEFYTYNHWTWALDFPNDRTQIRAADTPAQEIYLSDNFDSRIRDLTIDGFRVNLTEFQMEWAVISALIAEYRPSFECGIYLNETEARLQTWWGQMRQAGLPRIEQIVRRDYTAYVQRMAQ